MLCSVIAPSNLASENGDTEQEKLDINLQKQVFGLESISFVSAPLKNCCYC